MYMYICAQRGEPPPLFPTRPGGLRLGRFGTASAPGAVQGTHSQGGKHRCVAAALALLNPVLATMSRAGVCLCPLLVQLLASTARVAPAGAKHAASSTQRSEPRRRWTRSNTAARSAKGRPSVPWERPKDFQANQSRVRAGCL